MTTIPTYEELYRIALTWTSDEDRARAMVERWFDGQATTTSREVG